jgi:hypothetical protein
VTSGAPGTAAAFTVGLPTHADGDRFLLFVGGKYNTTTIPTINQGWVLLGSGTGGTGSAANDTGTTFWAVYASDAASSSEPAPTVTPGATAPNSWEWFCASFTPDAGQVWEDAITASAGWVRSATDATTTTPLTGTAGVFAAQPTTGDAIAVFGVTPTDTGTAIGTTTVTATGLSGGAITTTGGYVENNLGTDSAAVHAIWTGFSGTATAGVVMSFAITSSSNLSGSLVAVALRQMPPPPITCGPTAIASVEAIGSHTTRFLKTVTPIPAEFPQSDMAYSQDFETAGSVDSWGGNTMFGSEDVPTSVVQSIQPPISSGLTDLLLSNKPSVFLRLDEASGSLADSSGNGRTFTAGGTVTYGVAGIASDNNAISVSGAGWLGRAYESWMAGLEGGFVISCWIKPSAAGANTHRTIAGRYLTGNFTTSSWTFRVDSNNMLYFYGFGGGTYTAVSGGTPLNDVWQHVAVIVSGTSVTILLNGVIVASGSVAAITTTALGLTIGANSSNAELFKGGIDEFAYFSSPQAPQTVAAYAGDPGNWSGGVASSLAVTWAAPTGKSQNVMRNISSGYVAKPGSTYEVSVRVFAEEGSTTNYIALTVPFIRDVTIIPAGSYGTWVEVRGIVTPATDSFIAFENRGPVAGKRLWIDHVRVWPVLGTPAIAMSPTVRPLTVEPPSPIYSQNFEVSADSWAGNDALGFRDLPASVVRSSANQYEGGWGLRVTYAAPGANPQFFGRLISGLTPNTTYKYRMRLYIPSSATTGDVLVNGLFWFVGDPITQRDTWVEVEGEFAINTTGVIFGFDNDGPVAGGVIDLDYIFVWPTVSQVTITQITPIGPSGIASGFASGAHVLGGQVGVAPAAITSAQAVGVPAIAAKVTSQPAAIASAEAVSDLVLAMQIVVNPTGIATLQAFGTPVVVVVPLVVTVTLTGVVSAEAVPNLVLTPKITSMPNGIASQEVVPNLILNTFITSLLTGIASAQGFGTPVVAAFVTVSPNGVVTAEVFGATTITPKIAVQPSGIVSAEGLGNPAVTTRIAVIPLGIISGQALGTQAAFVIYTLVPTGIASTQAVGTQAISTVIAVTPDGVATVETVPNPSLLSKITSFPTGVASQEAVPAVVISTLVGTFLAGIASAEVVDVPTLSMLVALLPAGVASGQQFGAVSLSTLLNIAFNGIVSGQAVGTPVINPVITSLPAGIASALGFGVPVLSMKVSVSPIGVVSAQAFGVVSVDIVDLTNSIRGNGIQSAESFGVPAISGLVALSPSGVASGQVFGTITLLARITSSPSGIASVQAVSSPVLDMYVTSSPTGVASQESVQNPFLRTLLDAMPDGIISEELINDLFVQSILYITLDGIETVESVSDLWIGVDQSITITGIESEEGIGLHIVNVGPGAYFYVTVVIGGVRQTVRVAGFNIIINGQKKTADISMIRHRRKISII